MIKFLKKDNGRKYYNIPTGVLTMLLVVLYMLLLILLQEVGR